MPVDPRVALGTNTVEVMTDSLYEFVAQRLRPFEMPTGPLTTDAPILPIARFHSVGLRECFAEESLANGTLMAPST